MAPHNPPFQEQHGLFVSSSTSAVPTVTQSPTTGSHPRSLSSNEPNLPARPSLFLPVTYVPSAQEKHKATVAIDSTSEQSMNLFLKDDLDVSRLNHVHQHLWLAGLERPARPLHNQIAHGRQIVVTERADLHLLWEPSRIFIKPLPDYMLCHSIWMSYFCNEQAVFENAMGFLLSYIWLIGRKSDMRVAHQSGLISENITWESWRNFVAVVIEQIDYHTLANINIRYRRSELRLSRINWIYRFCSRTITVTTFFRGYLYGYDNYSTFITRNMTWLATAAVYIALVLTAMQVGLATKRLGSNTAFQNASYGFTIFSIMAPLVAVSMILMTVLILVIFNWRYTSRSRKTWSTKAIDRSAH